MMHLPRLIIAGVTAAIVIAVGWVFFGPTPDKTLTLTFQAKVGDEALVFDELIYDNPGGPGKFRIRDFRFYLSNLEMSGGGETFREVDSYHLLRFDNETKSYTMSFPDMPLDSVETVRFLIGVDEAANTSIEPRGALDPNSQMAWNWEVGYKFVVLEGLLEANGTTQPLVYHVGFAENARELEIVVPDEQSDGRNLTFDVNISAMFKGPTTVDMVALPSVKFDRADASTLAENYASMITPAF